MNKETEEQMWRDRYEEQIREKEGAPLGLIFFLALTVLIVTVPLLGGIGYLVVSFFKGLFQ